MVLREGQPALTGLAMTRLGSDGAAVMVGRCSGVVSHLKGRKPCLISIHCINHRLALAAGHAADSIPYLQLRFKPSFISITMTLYGMSSYNTSCIRVSYCKT